MVSLKHDSVHHIVVLGKKLKGTCTHMLARFQLKKQCSFQCQMYSRIALHCFCFSLLSDWSKKLCHPFHQSGTKVKLPGHTNVLSAFRLSCQLHILSSLFKLTAVITLIVSFLLVLQDSIEKQLILTYSNYEH